MSTKAMYEGIARCLRLAIVVLMVAMVICIFTQVFTRYVLNNSIPWTEEVARYVIVYLTFFGGALAVHEDKHIKLDFVVELLPPATQRILRAVSSFMMVLTSLLLIYYGTVFAYLGRDTISPAIEQSMAWVYSAMPAAGVLMLIYAIPWIFSHLRGREAAPK